MRHSILFIFLVIFCWENYAQDKLNFFDETGSRQGKWIIYGKNLSGSCYQPDQIAEEGNYKDNNKNGAWLEYHCNKNIKSELWYVGGKADGPSKSYYENGKLEEEGVWKDNHWIGEYKKYTSEGALKKLVIYDQNGNPDPAFKDKFFPKKEQTKPVTEMDAIDSKKIITDQSTSSPDFNSKEKENKKPFYVNPK